MLLDLIALTNWDKIPDWMIPAWRDRRWKYHRNYYQAECYGMRCLQNWGLY